MDVHKRVKVDKNVEWNHQVKSNLGRMRSTTTTKSSIFVVFSVTGWLDYFLSIWPFTTMKICPME